VSEQDILDMISTLDANKAVGPDIISNKMLIAVKVQISKPLCMLFNKSLHQNIFPTDWKLSHVIPLFKAGDKSFPSNYRPVSLLSCVSKLLEKIVLNISLIIYREINYCVNFSQVFYQVDLLPINL
jgi:sarcosine oxidase/L-pipecolate oxidase